jgi:hypothetical protein
MRRKLAVLAVAIGLVGVGAVAAWASIPGPDGVIHGCYKPSTGAVTVIDSSASCGSGLTALNWNQTGPQGPAGSPGVSGYEIVSQTDTPADTTRRTTTATCPSGKLALGGGVRRSVNGTSDGGDDFYLKGSYPLADGTGWAADYNDLVSGSTVTVYAICATVAS